MQAAAEPRRSCAIARRRARSCAASAGIPGAACSIPTSRPTSSSWRPPSRCTWRGSPTSRRRRRRRARLRPLAGDFAYHALRAGHSRRRPDRRAGARGLRRLRALPRPWAGSGAWSARPTDARGFYGIIAVSVLAGLVIQYSPISPMKALFWSAVINGVVAVPLMAVIILLVSKKSVMGAFTATRSLIVLGWIATAVMGAAAVGCSFPARPWGGKRFDAAAEHGRHDRTDIGAGFQSRRAYSA